MGSDESSSSDNTTIATESSSSSEPDRELPSIENETSSFDDEVQDEEEGQRESLLASIRAPPRTSNSLRQLANFAMAAHAAATNVAASASNTLHERTVSTTTARTTPSLPGYPTLAKSGSVPRWAKFLVPFLCVACQVIFYYGQTEPMWKLHVNADVHVWANATEYTARRTFQILGLDYQIPLDLDEKKDVQTFTYMFAIQELWKADGLPGTFLPRSAAVLLIIFSGLWPHLKLLMLNITWFFGRHKTRRTKILAWLAGLGKWSLADVLVVCVMVGVLNLDWIVDPGAIKEGVIDDLPSILQIVETLYTKDQVCDHLLKMNCAHEKRVTHIAKCKACKSFLSEAFGHPEWARSNGRKILNGVSTSGGGTATLRVVGMHGIYYFCGAVILSIFLSLVVDIFDHRAKLYERKREEEARGIERGYRERGGLLLGERPVRRLISETDRPQRSTTANPSYFDDNDDRLDTPLLTETTSSSLDIEIPRGFDDNARSINNTKRLFSIWFLMATLCTLVAVYMAAEKPTMERLVHGAGPKLLHEILGVDWQRPYSFQTLMWTTGAAGGMDYMLMGTFGLFCVVGPVIRAVLLFFTVVLDQCKISATNLAVIVNFLGSFCAWEVFAIATIMVQMLMPSITDTIIRNPACGQISSDDNGSCLMIEFNLVPFAFSLVVIGGTTLVVLSWIATGRLLVDETEYEPSRIRGSMAERNTIAPSPLSRIMRQNHNYERLQGIEEGTRTSNSTSGGDLEELVFETNQL